MRSVYISIESSPNQLTFPSASVRSNSRVENFVSAHCVCCFTCLILPILYSWCLLFDSLFCNFNIIIPSASIWLRWWSVICRWRGRERLTTLLVCLLPAWLSFWPKKNTPRESQRVHVIKLQLDDGGGINLWIHCGEAGGKIQSECKF